MIHEVHIKCVIENLPIVIGGFGLMLIIFVIVVNLNLKF